MSLSIYISARKLIVHSHLLLQFYAWFNSISFLPVNCCTCVNSILAYFVFEMSSHIHALALTSLHILIVHCFQLVLTDWQYNVSTFQGSRYLFLSLLKLVSIYYLLQIVLLSLTSMEACDLYLQAFIFFLILFIFYYDRICNFNWHYVNVLFTFLINK